MNDQWKVTAYTCKNRDVSLGCTFVRADSEDEAKLLGHKALKLTGVRGRFRVSVRRYEPWNDLAFRNFIKVTP